MKQWTIERLSPDRTVLMLLQIVGPSGIYSMHWPYAKSFVGRGGGATRDPTDVGAAVEELVSQHIRALQTIQEGPNGPTY
jgi:hypothetical protein